MLAFAKCCSVLSFTGIVFLVIIGRLLQTQPLYIKGPEDPEAAAAGCYGGAAIYAVTMTVSILYWKSASKASGSGLSPRSSNGYGAVPQ
jgi:hypothetical protein